jgi:geranylgeranyl diphosphate synthase type I
VVGKPSGSDIRRRKKSFPIALSFSRAEAADRLRLTEIYGQREVPDADVRWVIAAMDRLGVREDGAQRVREHLKEATETLDGLPWSEATRNGMAELIAFLARREK